MDKTLGKRIKCMPLTLDCLAAIFDAVGLTSEKYQI